MASWHKDLQVFQAIPAAQVTIDDQFWKPRVETNERVSLFYQYECLVASGVMDNFRLAGASTKKDGSFRGLFFADSDAYKWLEAASLSLVKRRDSRLEGLMDQVITLIAAAQEENGYINTYFQLVEPDRKYTNFGVCHELYTAGHLILAGVAHYNALGKKRLLNIACRLADHLVAVFGPGKLEAVDGHAGIEMALVSLYRVTGERRYLELAQFFINQRGSPNSRLRFELAHLDEIAGKLGRPGQNNLKHYGTFNNYTGQYAQDHQPVREQSEVVGHAVRAMYLYCGMADVAVETGDFTLISALERLWGHVTSRRMYITGGIGPARANEGFTHDFDLPNDTTCAESCAAVGMIFWNHRMLQITGAGRYADLMERVLYNAFLAGVSLDGQHYFYNNPLQSRGDCHREAWNECACCPPNIARLLASVGGYPYSRSSDSVAVHLYLQSEVKLEAAPVGALALRQETNYPWDGKARFTLEPERPAGFELLLRIPGWARSYQLKLNHKVIQAPLRDGYAVIKRTWTAGDRVELDLPMPVERITAHPAVWQDAGRVALQRGPLVYCIEGVDHGAPVEQIVLPEEARLVSRFVDDLCGGVVAIEGEALVPDLFDWQDKLYRQMEEAPKYNKTPFRAVPFYCWDNRGPGGMAVWINGKT
ncbi:MAG: glycoside hydrolase family 127 protein [Firmicutes bacterium]|nr:glycoside hydrolase family 127 protein [Bacillota bacterium]